MKAPQIVIDAVLKVARSERLIAARVAESSYFAALEKLDSFGDFDRRTNEQMAADAAAAEITYRFS